MVNIFGLEDTASREPEFRIIHRDGSEWLIARARMNWLQFAMSLLVTFIVSLFGLAAIISLTAGLFLFFLFWLLFLAPLWLVAACSIAWQVHGRAMVTVRGNSLIYRSIVGLIPSTRQYRTDLISNLFVDVGRWTADNRYFRRHYPPNLPFVQDRIKFDYNGRTEVLGFGLDHIQHGLIIDWIEQRLPDKRG